MKINLKSIVVLLLLIFIGTKSYADNYLNKSELIKIGAASFGVAGIGLILENQVDLSQTPIIKGPILFDKYFQELIGGDLSINSRKTNFLDNKTGALFTPALGFTVLLAVNYSQNRNSKRKQLLQDSYLFTTGLLATGGITATFKGLIARERPYYYENPQSRLFEKDSKLSFFSGHASTAFFSMHYLNKRISYLMKENNVSLKWQLLKSITGYGWASYVAVSRIHASKHYATDVIVGSGVGFLIAELFYRFGEKKNSNFSLRSTSSSFVLNYYF